MTDALFLIGSQSDREAVEPGLASFLKAEGPSFRPAIPLRPGSPSGA